MKSLAEPSDAKQRCLELRGCGWAGSVAGRRPVPFVHLHFVLLVLGTQQRRELGSPAPGGVQAAPVCVPEVGWCSGCSTPWQS